MPLISVIMSVYNDEKYVSKSVESILGQTFKDFEFIITDDCSKDNSLKILREYAEKDNRIVLVENKENLKLTKNLNSMLEIAKGKLIARMDSDDISFPDRFEKQVKIFKNHPEIDFVFTGTIIIDDEGNEICETWRPPDVKSILKMLKYTNFIPHPTVMIKKELFIKNGKYTELNGYGQEDKEMWQKFLKSGCRFQYLNEILLKYRINPKGISYNKNSFSLSYRYKLISHMIDSHQKFKALKSYISNFTSFNINEHLHTLYKLILPVKCRYIRSILAQKLLK